MKILLFYGFLFSSLLIVGCGGVSDSAGSGDSAVGSSEDSVFVDRSDNVELVPVDKKRTSEVEARAGLLLPEDAAIFVAVGNASAYMFSFYTGLSGEEARDFMQVELISKGYEVERDWMSFSVQDYTSYTALFSAQGKAASVSIEDQGGRRLVNVTLQ